MPEITIATPDVESATKDAQPLIQSANAVMVSNQEEHGIALSIIKDLTGAERHVVGLFADPKKKAHDAHKSICAAETKLLDPIKKAKRIVSGKCDQYEAEQRRIAAEEQRRLQEEARKQEAERLAREAEEAEKAGDNGLAEEILEEAAAMESGKAAAPVVAVAPKVAVVEGISSRTIWKAEVVDMKALIKYVAAHPEWSSLLDPNMPNLNGLARAQRDSLAIPGVRAVSEMSRATRI